MSKDIRHQRMWWGKSNRKREHHEESFSKLSPHSTCYTIITAAKKVLLTCSTFVMSYDPAILSVVSCLPKWQKGRKKTCIAV